MAGRRWCRVAAVGVLVFGGLGALTETMRAQLAKGQGRMSTIRGRAVHAETGEPLRRVQIRVEQWSGGDGGPASTMTGPDGRYTLPVAAGRYQLIATRGGYVQVAYGERRAFARGRPVTLAAGQVLEDIDFALAPGAVVTGQILDEVGEPVAGVHVSLARDGFVQDGRRLVSRHGASTDDRGRFRIFGVAPGEYVLLAVASDLDSASTDSVRDVPTYYPGTASIAEAQWVTLASGQERGGFDMRLVRAPTAAIRGRLRAVDNRPASPLTFVVAEALDPVTPSGRTVMDSPRRDGSFVLGGLQPGRYRVAARAATTNDEASTEVTVTDGDIDGVVLVLSPGVAVRGRITFDTGTPPTSLRPSDVLLLPGSLDERTSFIGGSRPQVRDDWSFEVHGLRDRGFLRAATLAVWQMKAVYLNGQDVTDVPLDFRNGDLDGLEIELTTQQTTLSGTVTGEGGAVALESTVVAFADDRAQWGRHSRFIQATRVDQRGRFSISGLPPGQYRGIAVEYLEPGEERDMALLDDWYDRAVRLSLAEGETRVLALTLSAP
jgi:hypothetical protein